MQNTYYFKFVVPDHYAIEHNSYKQAIKSAKRLKESIYLQIFHRRNIYKEPYGEIKLSFEETDVSLLNHKASLIAIFNKYAGG